VLNRSFLTTALDLPGYRITRNLGVVRGIVVRSRSIVGTIGAGIQSLFGGNITLWTEMCERARQEAFDLMARHAEEVQDILGMRQDLVVTREALLEEAGRRPTDGPFNLAVGRLLELENQSIAAYDRQFGRSWRAFNRKKNRDWLNK